MRVLVLALVTALAACGSGADPSAEPDTAEPTAPATTTAATTTAATEPATTEAPDEPAGCDPPSKFSGRHADNYGINCEVCRTFGPSEVATEHRIASSEEFTIAEEFAKKAYRPGFQQAVIEGCFRGFELARQEGN